MHRTDDALDLTCARCGASYVRSVSEIGESSRCCSNAMFAVFDGVRYAVVKAYADEDDQPFRAFLIRVDQGAVDALVSAAAIMRNALTCAKTYGISPPYKMCYWGPDFLRDGFVWWLEEDSPDASSDAQVSCFLDGDSPTFQWRVCKFGEGYETEGVNLQEFVHINTYRSKHEK